MFDILEHWVADHELLLAVIGSLLFLPWLVAQIPSDYFCHKRREPAQWKQLHPVLRYTILVVKNMMGLILLLAGTAMLMLPGQGLLGILLGLILMDYPGKFQLERQIVSRPKLLQFINWLRRKQKKPPLLFEP